jgi:hypothetical protein
MAFLLLLLPACTPKEKASPDYTKYLSDTELMLNITQKFAFEPDAQKLNKVAVATQQTRVVSCTDFNDECSLYGKFLSNIIEYSDDGTINPEERKKMELQYNQLNAAIKEGRWKLKLEKK